MSSVDHKPSIPQHKMKTLNSVVVWTFVGVLIVILHQGVNCDTFTYSGRSSLQSYSPARGEFPVQSIFGQGYFSFVDMDGNAKIVSLEPNPLLGVRVSADGQPQIDIGHNIDLESRISDKQKQDRLKPIKEFDEKPFVDSAEPNQSSLPPLSLSTITVPKQQGQIFIYTPPAAASGLDRRIAAPAPGTSGNPFLPLGIVFPNPSPPMNTGATVFKPITSPAPGQVFPNPQPCTENLLINHIPTTTAPRPAIPEIVFPNSPLLPSGAEQTITNPQSPQFAGNPFLPPGSIPTTAAPVFSSSPVTQAVIFKPTPSSGNPFLPINNKKDQSPPWTSVSTPAATQFIPDKNNPFLSNLARTDLTPELPTRIVTEMKSSSETTVIPSTLTGDETANPEQVKDTPEVEQAKREHFLAHELALARLEMARQQGDDESSSLLSASSSSSSVYLSTDAASPQPVTSGPLADAITEQTTVAAAGSDAVLERS